MRKLFLIVSIFAIISTNAQNTLNGVIRDSKNRPIENASVYINGTSIGTATDSRGSFKLENLTFPAELVASHIGYDLQVEEIKKPTFESFNIVLKEKKRQIDEVTVTGKSNRAENIKMFKDAFLGTDNWGKKAVLLNDSVLLFSHHTDTIKNRFIVKTLSVTAKAPLEVDLPLLGYTLSVDLTEFILDRTKYRTETSLLGYFFYKPYNFENKFQQTKIERNRVSAYYNSQLHFLRALAADNLCSEGYLITAVRKIPGEKGHYSAINLPVIKNDSLKNAVFVYGQAKKKYHILYNGNNRRPTNMCKSKALATDENRVITKALLSKNYEKQSSIFFSSDTCIIRVDGTSTDNSILFEGKMAEKMVGSMLPRDYSPEKDVLDEW